MMLLAALLLTTAASTTPVFWEILPATPPPVPSRAATPSSLIGGAANFEGCYALIVPAELSLGHHGSFRVFLSRVDTNSPSRFAAFFEPPSLLRTTWTIDDEGALVAWSTGESGVYFRLAKVNGILGAKVSAFSDNLSRREGPWVSIQATEIDCPAELLAGPEERSRERRIVACAVLLNIKNRRETRLKMDLSPDSQLLEAEMARLRAASDLSISDVTHLSEECYTGTSDSHQACRQQVATVQYSEMPLVLAPELKPQPPVPSGYCRAAPLFGYFHGTVKETGSLVQPDALSLAAMPVSPTLISQMARVLEESSWIPALECGVPVEARVQVRVRRYLPCDDS